MANPLRKTMVYLGLADEELDYEESEVATTNHSQYQSSAPTQTPRAQVTPLRRAPRAPQSGQGMNEILTVNPRQFKDVKAIAETYRDGIPVIMNISEMSDLEARRLIDFASGLAEGLYGRIERVSNKVFLLSPAHVAVNGSEQASDDSDEQSFFVDR
ncbi:MAG: cell division protein SepF [Cryobacterium sp.]|nr:cell division protein SepF [Cryobacterium sp.]